MVGLSGSVPPTGTATATKSCLWAGGTITLETALGAFYSTVFLDAIIRNPMIDDLCLHKNDKVSEDGDLGNALGGVAHRITEFVQLPIFV